MTRSIHPTSNLLVTYSKARALAVRRPASIPVLAVVVILMCHTGRAEAQCSPEEFLKLTALGEAGGDIFGYSVAVSGDTALVGAIFDDHGGSIDFGSVYVFVHDGLTWSEQQRLFASDAATDDNFGNSVSVSGDTAVVGSYYDDHAGSIDAGSAYVYLRGGGSWIEQAKLTATDAAADDRFGYSVSVSGDTAFVGARQDDHAGGMDAGSVYVFVRSVGIWSEAQKLIASDAAFNDYFGGSVAISNDTAVVGTYGDDHSGVNGAGSAYVFVRSGGVWIQQAKLTASDAAEGDGFGHAVGISGDTVVVASVVDDLAGGTDAGSAYVFVKPIGGWVANMTETAKLTASDAAANDWFGYTVSVAGDTVVVGAPLTTHAGGTTAGSAYVFVRPSSGWVNMTESAGLPASDAASGDVFGISVAVSNDTALVGAFGDDGACPADPGCDSGSAYIFDLCAPTGACCDGAASCSITTATACGGTFQGSGTTCTPNPCLPPTGACCDGDGSCSITTAAACGLAGDTYLGDGIPCSANTCKGACCLGDGQCRFGTQKFCVLILGGSFRGFGTTCPAFPLCGSEGDLNGDGATSGSDIACFTDCVIDPTPDPSCNCDNVDLNDDGVIDAADFNIFVCLLLELWPTCW